MKKIITILTCGLSVAAFAYILSPTLLTLFLSLISTWVIVAFALWLEEKIKTKGNQWINKILYHFTRDSEDYDFQSMQCTYSCLSENKYECSRVVDLRTNRSIRNINEHFRWSTDSSAAKIEPYDKTHKIKGMHQENDWTCYSVDFGKMYPKNEKITTGSTITNLSDPDNKAVPFLSYTIVRKTKQLILTVEFSKDRLPLGDVVFKTKAFNKEIGNPKVLKYNPEIEGYSETILYPRKGWQYIISWEKNS